MAVKGGVLDLYVILLEEKEKVETSCDVCRGPSSHLPVFEGRKTGRCGIQYSKHLRPPASSSHITHLLSSPFPWGLWLGFQGCGIPFYFLL